MKKIFTCLRRQEHLSVFILFLAIILAVSGCGKKDKTPFNPPLQKGENYDNTASYTPVSENGQTAASSSETAQMASSTDEIDILDWKTYRNEEYKYELKYPKEWVVEESDYYDKNFNWHVKNVIFKSPNSEYSLIFGLARKDEDIIFVPRTGFGAVDEILKEKIINIGEAKVEVLYSIYNKAVREVYYSKLNSHKEPYEYFEINNFLAHATLRSGNSYEDNFDFRDTKELKLAEKILKFFKFTD